jgi:flagellar protein FlgJ
MSFTVNGPLQALTASPTGPTGSAAEIALKKRRIAETAQQFEASFISQMLKPMFDSLNSDGLFQGGQGEEMFRSFLVDAVSKQAAKSGGVGVADVVQREMLKLQGLTEEGTTNHGA